jgi:hypothetical protein
MQRDPQHSDRKTVHENRPSSYKVVTTEETNEQRSERGIVGKIYGLVKEAERWRMGTNKEVKGTLKVDGIVKFIKSLRMIWYGNAKRLLH